MSKLTTTTTTMMTKLLVTAALFTGCEHDHRIEYNPEIVAIDGQHKAMLRLQRAVEDEYAVSLGDMYNTHVHWVSKKCAYKSDDYAVTFRGECYYGYMFNCDEMYVSVSNADPTHVCGTALLHEFGHCLRGLVEGNKDPNHNDAFWWSIVRRSDKEVCNAK